MTEKYVTFRRESSWENGSMLFAHVLRTPDDEIVEISANKFVTEGVFFSLARHAYEEICCIAAAFEKSISYEYRANQLSTNETKNASGTDEEKSDEEEAANESTENIGGSTNLRTVYVDRRSRRTRGNRYHAVLSSLLS